MFLTPTRGRCGHQWTPVRPCSGRTAGRSLSHLHTKYEIHTFCVVLRRREWGTCERSWELTAQVVNFIVAFMFSVEEPCHLLQRAEEEVKAHVEVHAALLHFVWIIFKRCRVWTCATWLCQNYLDWIPVEGLLPRGGEGHGDDAV